MPRENCFSPGAPPGEECKRSQAGPSRVSQLNTLELHLETASVTLAESAFWLSAVLFFHTWGGYPLLLSILVRLKGSRAFPAVEPKRLPSVSVIIPAYNASARIVKKLKNTLALDYPGDRFEVIVVSDGSNDDTVELARAVKSPNIEVLALRVNAGKSAAQNHGVRHSKGGIIVFTDVDSDLDRAFLKNITLAFSDPGVACAGGHAVLISDSGDVSSSQGVYWRLEQFIRRAESTLGMLHSLPGWGFAVRREDFVPLDTDTGDDMILPLEAALKGRRSVLVPGAIVRDRMPSSVKGETKARQRITLRNLRGVMKRRELLLPWRHPRMSFTLWSHKMLRWASPLLLISMLSTSAVLFLTDGGLYAVALAAQLFSYGAGLVGLAAAKKGIKIPVAGHMSSFMVANMGLLVGLFRFTGGHRVKSYRNAA